VIKFILDIMRSSYQGGQSKSSSTFPNQLNVKGANRKRKKRLSDKKNIIGKKKKIM